MRASLPVLLTVALAVGGVAGWLATRTGSGATTTAAPSQAIVHDDPLGDAAGDLRTGDLAPATAEERRAAITAGLAWLARTQEQDGSWDLVRWSPWHGRSGLHGFTEEDHWFQPGATGLALLAFLESGSPGLAHVERVQRGLARLVAWQQPDGRIGHDPEVVDTWFREQAKIAGRADPGGPGYRVWTLESFNHAVASAALAVAARAPGGERWREAAARALAYMAGLRHREYRWSAFLDPETDIGVVAFVALAARAGADAGARDEAAPLLAALPEFLERITDPATGRTAMLSDQPACFDGDDSTAINAYVRRLLGQAPVSAPLRLTLASLVRTAPAWREAQLPPADSALAFSIPLGPVVNHEVFTYGVLATTEADAPRAGAWREAVRALLVHHQETDGEQVGAWEPVGVWDRVGGRVYTTAMAVRALAAP